MKAIGNTPLIKLQRLTGPDSADIYVKLESTNPTGSMKDRMALSMIEGAEQRGELKPGGAVVEYTGGSTGSSLAMICANKGYHAHLVSSDAFAEEKLQTMLAFGADLEIIPSENGLINARLFTAMIERARALSKMPNTFWTDQFNNIDNRNAYHTMAKEIIAVLGNTIDEFVMGVGTGACFSGNAEIFKAQMPGIRCVAIEPLHVRALSGGDISGTHKLEGIGSGFVPSICRLDLADEIIAVSNEDAYETARKLASIEGIFGGITSGANVWAAMQRARVIGPGKTIVTIIVDSGLKYLNGDLYKRAATISNAAAYNTIAEQWIESRHRSTVSKLVVRFSELVKQNGTILDIGCGSGIPIARFLQEQGFTVTGIDISEKMIALARQQLMNTSFFVADINDYESDQPFDGIVAWDSLFHLPPALQQKAYIKIYSLLSDGGYVLFTGNNVNAEIIGKMYGEQFYYGGIEANQLKTILAAAGFTIVFFEEDYKEGDMDRGVVAILKK